MIAIVSGLPRSGTSMMMRMLAVGGLPILADDARPPDAGNPDGYYEYAKTPDIELDSSWVAEAEGKAVKIVSLGLYRLPPAHRYKVIFMTRDINRVLASQSAMLGRNGLDVGRSDEMRRHFFVHLTKLRGWLAQQANMEVLYLAYESVVASPFDRARIVCRFLERDLDPVAMAKIVRRR